MVEFTEETINFVPNPLSFPYPLCKATANTVSKPDLTRQGPKSSAVLVLLPQEQQILFLHFFANTEQKETAGISQKLHVNFWITAETKEWV